MNSQKNEKKFYRIINEEILKKREKDRTPQKLTQQVIRKNKFIYIDVNQQSGFKAMERINPQDLDYETEKIGSNVIGSLNNLSKQSQSVLDYVYKVNQLRTNNSRHQNLLIQNLNTIMHSPQKINDIKQRQNKSLVISRINDNHIKQNQKHKVNPKKSRSLKKEKESYETKAHHSIQNHERINIELQTIQNSLLKKMYDHQSPIVYRAMNTQKINDIMAKVENQKRRIVNQHILEKQRKLIQKYGMTNQYESILKQKSPIVRTSGRRIQLPQINSLSTLQL